MLDVMIETKQEVQHDDYTEGKQPDADVQFVEGFPQEKRKAILRKIDFRLPPVLVLLYCEYGPPTSGGQASLIVLGSACLLGPLQHCEC